MIDLHCHLLPGIDDGAQTLKQALELAQAAVDNGITHAVCTPHIHLGRFDNNETTISTALHQLQYALLQDQIPLQIGMGAEVRLDIELMPLIEANNIPLLGRWQNQPVLLLELPHGSIPTGSDRFTEWLRKQGIRPMIAHPERNKGLMKQPTQLDPFLKQGCLLQLTAGSVIGDFGEPAQTLALQLLERDVATIVATDTHHISRRPPKMSEAHRFISEHFDEAMADRLCCDNPWVIAHEHFS